MSELVEQNILSDKQFADFLAEIEKIPSLRASLDGQQAKLCFEFMEDTGLRVNETIHVKREDLDFMTRILTVMQPKSEKKCKCSKWKYKDLYSRSRVLEYADPDCPKCHGKGKWKKPQRTTFTPRIESKLKDYCEELIDSDLLFPITRQTLWNWGKEAGRRAGINIFQQKDEKLIKGIFLHLFRALCSKRVTRDAKDDPYQDELVSCKLRHATNNVTDRYTKIDINYLLAWEARTYS